jgi:hypothetical protein
MIGARSIMIEDAAVNSGDVCSFPGNKKCPSSKINEGQDR